MRSKLIWATPNFIPDPNKECGRLSICTGHWRRLFLRYLPDPPPPMVEKKIKSIPEWSHMFPYFFAFLTVPGSQNTLKWQTYEGNTTNCLRFVGYLWHSGSVLRSVQSFCHPVYRMVLQGGAIIVFYQVKIHRWNIFPQASQLICSRIGI